MSQQDSLTGPSVSADAQRPEPRFDQIDFDRPAGTQIFAALKAAILKMDLPPGCFLSESEIGVKFGASRTPVREAFLQLREAGLVTTYPSRGNFVTRLNRGKILEARFLREAIEIANVSYLIETGLTASSQEEVRANLAAQTEAIAQGDQGRFHVLDDRFHGLLAAATGYSRVAHVLEREKMLLDRLRALSLRDKEHQERLLEEHRQIFEAILAQDKTAAVSITKMHLMSILEMLSLLEAKHSDYFD